MNAPTTLPDAVPDTGWGAALDAFEARIDRLERRLRDDDWDDGGTVDADQAAPLSAPPSPAERARGRALTDRAAACHRRLAAELGRTRAELAGIPVRRVAAARYAALPTPASPTESLDEPLEEFADGAQG